MKEEIILDESNTNWKIVFIGGFVIMLIFDILEEGLSSMGYFIGWLVGLLTMSIWQDNRLKEKR
jgi:hypothetical protein